MGEKPTRYNWVKKPVARQLANQLLNLDDGPVATLGRFEWLVWRNPPGVEGLGYVYLDTGQKAPKEQVLLMLARMNPSGKREQQKNLDTLKAADEVAFDSKGRPYLKHWRRDRDREPTNTAENRKRSRDRDLVPEAQSYLPWFLKTGEPRTMDALCGWLGYKMKRDPNTTMRRVVDLMVADGVVDESEGVISVSSSVLPTSQASPAPPPPVAGELEAKGSDLPPTCRGDIDYSSKAEEVFCKNPIESIGEGPDNDDAAAPSSSDSPSAEAGGGGAGERYGAPVGRCGQVREGPRVDGSARPWRDMGFERRLSGGRYRGWVEGTHPHPRCSLDDMLDFKADDLWNCDLIDAMMFLAPDGTPPGDPVYPRGQEAAFKSLLGKINRAAGSMEHADRLIRERVFMDYIEAQQRKRKPFERDAAVLMKMLNALHVELRGGVRK